jgi:phosphopantothenoylcysteine decarboxylase/phosphopantothenate--cysteine ligase
MTTNNTPYPFPDEGISPELLITAGPTHEPIDAVRFIGNRSSGKLGILLAEHAAGLGWDTTLLLGPTCHAPVSDDVKLHRFVSTTDLRHLLDLYTPKHDVLVMAAAVADFTPAAAAPSSKLRRTESENFILEFVPTPDLLAECCRAARADQLMVGFALEPADELLESARNKLGRKNADMIVANPLETMESGEIQASIIASKLLTAYERCTEGKVSKAEFAQWLLPILAGAWNAKHISRENHP